MTDRPIIFKDPMILAILEGRKTQTRRLAWGKKIFAPSDIERHGTLRPTPYQKYKPGDRLWVRETFVLENNMEYREDTQWPDDNRPIKTIDNGIDWGESELIPHYRATEPEPSIVPDGLEDHSDDRTRWTPSIFMPRWASRLTLTVTDVRIEPLQDISESDAKAEGAMFFDGRPNGHHGWRHVYHDVYPTARDSFAALWGSIHDADRVQWGDNPDVVVITFDAEKRNIDR